MIEESRFLNRQSSFGNRQWVAPAALFLLLVAAVYADPLLLRRNFAGRDLLSYNLPMEKAIHDAWASGRLPVWMADISGGRPLLPNPNAGALYPGRAVLSLLAFPAAMRLFPVLHWVLAGAGVICLLTSIGASPGAAWIAAVTYDFSGVVAAESFFPHYMPGMALLPWILWGIERAGLPRGRILALSVLFALEFLAGDVFQIAVVIAASLLWILLEVERALRARRLSALALALFFGALAAAPQIVATALWIPQTRRAVTGIPLRDSLLYSISPFRLLEFAVPYPFGPIATDPARLWTRAIFHQKTGGLFTTLYCGAFAVIAFVACLRARARGARFARALVVAALLASVVPSLLPASWGSLPSPVALRNPEKFAIAVVLGLALLSGLAFDALRRSRPLPRWTLAAGALLGLLAASARLFPAGIGSLALGLVGDRSAAAAPAGRELALAFTEGGLLWMGAVLALAALSALPRTGPAVSLALLTLCPIVATRRIAHTLSESAIFEPTAFARYQRKADPQGAYRALGESIYLPPSGVEAYYSRPDLYYTDFPRRVWYEHTQALWGRGTVFNLDIDAGDLSRMDSLRRVAKIAAGYSGSQNFFGSLSLKWGARYRDQPPLPGYRRMGGDGLQIFDEHERAFPDVRLAQTWSEEADAAAALAALPRLAAGEIVIETGTRRRGAAQPGRVRLLEKSPERMLLDVEAPDPAWLFVLREYWRYRRVLVDGRETEVFPAQLAFSAVPVPAGRHRIEWVEEAPGWGFARFGPALSALGLLWIWQRGSRGRESRRESP